MRRSWRARTLLLCICTTLLCVCTITSVAVAAPLRLAVLPPRDATLGALSARVEAALVEAAQALPGYVVANLAGARLTAPRKTEPHLETQPAARALALGKETGAQRAIAVEATPLGDGLVVYLQALEVPSGRALGSTTLSLAGGAAHNAADRDTVRAALTRVLDPSRNVGRLQIRLDVQGAEVQIDGHPSHAGIVELAVGTHALRVTHPAYHDFLRFLDVEFDKTLPVDVNMAAYPLAEGEMTERQRRDLATRSRRSVPWWRSWWALSLAGVVITGVTAGVVWGLRAGLPSVDSSSPYRPVPQP